MRNTIPGTLDADALAALVGRQPAPSQGPRNRREFRTAARDLVAQGRSTQEVARLLRLTPRGVLDLLAEVSDQSQPSPFRQKARGES